MLGPLVRRGHADRDRDGAEEGLVQSGLRASGAEATQYDEGTRAAPPLPRTIGWWAISSLRAARLHTQVGNAAPYCQGRARRCRRQSDIRGATHVLRAVGEPFLMICFVRTSRDPFPERRVTEPNTSRHGKEPRLGGATAVIGVAPPRGRHRALARTSRQRGSTANTRRGGPRVAFAHGGR
jgi:hypothetical protein